MKKVYTIPKSEIEQPIEAVAKIVDGKIVVEIETDDSTLPKLGDFLTSSEGKTFICNGKRNENNMVGSIAGQISDKSINVNPVSDWCKIEDCHYSDKTEIDNFLKLLKKTCYKKWDFENKKLVNTFIPKDGDYVKFGNNFVHYAIYNSPSKVYKNAFKAYAFYNSFELKFNTCDLCSDNIRPMTLNEKRNFNMILKSNSKKWNFETRKFDDTKWNPMVSEEYFYINSFGAIAKTTREYENKIDEMRIKIGNCFQTEENAQIYAEKFKNLFLEKE